MPIIETAFGPKRYLSLRKSIAISQITDKQIYDSAGKKLGEYMGQNGFSPSGPWSVLYFTWDEAGQKAEIGISFPVDGLQKNIYDPELTMVDVPKSKASMYSLRGSYEGLGDVHKSLKSHVAKKDFKGKGLPVIAVEEYVVDPMGEPKEEKWVTNVYYLHN